MPRPWLDSIVTHRWPLHENWPGWVYPVPVGLRTSNRCRRAFRHQFPIHIVRYDVEYKRSRNCFGQKNKNKTDRIILIVVSSCSVWQGCSATCNPAQTNKSGGPPNTSQHDDNHKHHINTINVVRCAPKTTTFHRTKKINIQWMNGEALILWNMATIRNLNIHFSVAR